MVRSFKASPRSSLTIVPVATFARAGMSRITGSRAGLDIVPRAGVILLYALSKVSMRHGLKFTRYARNKHIFFTMAGIADSLGEAVAPGQQQGQGNYVSAEVSR